VTACPSAGTFVERENEPTMSDPSAEDTAIAVRDGVDGPLVPDAVAVDGGDAGVVSEGAGTIGDPAGADPAGPSVTADPGTDGTGELQATSSPATSPTNADSSAPPDRRMDRRARRPGQAGSMIAGSFRPADTTSGCAPTVECLLSVMIGVVGPQSCRGTRAARRSASAAAGHGSSPCSVTSPSRCAIVAAFTRLSTPSFPRMLETWTLAVFGLM